MEESNKNNQKGILFIGVLLLIISYLALEKLTEKKVIAQQAKEQLKPVNESESCYNKDYDFEQLAACRDKQKKREYANAGLKIPEINSTVKFIDLNSNKEVATELKGRFFRFKRTESLDLSRCAHNTPVKTVEPEYLNLLADSDKMFIICLDDSSLKFAAYATNNWESKEIQKQYAEWKASLLKAKEDSESMKKGLGPNPKNFPPPPADKAGIQKIIIDPSKIEKLKK